MPVNLEKEFDAYELNLQLHIMGLDNLELVKDAGYIGNCEYLLVDRTDGELLDSFEDALEAMETIRNYIR